MRRVIIKTPFPIEKGETRVDHKGLFLPRLYLSNGGSANRSSFRGPRYYITAYLRFPRAPPQQITRRFNQFMNTCLNLHRQDFTFQEYRRWSIRIEAFFSFYFPPSLPSSSTGQSYPVIFYFANHDRCWIIAARHRSVLVTVSKDGTRRLEIRRICVHVYSRVGK